MTLQKFVWDNSALVALINSDEPHHCYSFMKNHQSDIHIFPTIAWMEFQAAQSAKQRRTEKKVYRELWLLDEKNIVYEITQNFIEKVHKNELHLKFDRLRGMDLIYASVAWLEKAPLVTLDSDFKKIQGINLIYPNEI